MTQKGTEVGTTIRQAGKIIRAACRRAQAQGYLISAFDWGINRQDDGLAGSNDWKVCPLGAVVLGIPMPNEGDHDIWAQEQAKLTIGYTDSDQFDFLAGVDEEVIVHSAWTRLGARIIREFSRMG